MANDRMKREKQSVTIGEDDPDLDMFQISEGLDNDSLIAWPDENCVSGAKATTELVCDDEEFEEESFGSMDEEFFEEMPGEEALPDDLPEDESIDTETGGEPAAEPAG